MIRYVEGNIFDTDCDIIAHGCNCRGGFGKGIALQVAKQYPKVREAYLRKHEDEGWKLGEIQPVKIGEDKYIINCATQDRYWNPGRIQKTYVDYDSFHLCMSRVLAFAQENRYSIAIPKIGAGLAGGNWDILEMKLEDVFADADITVYTL